jgi:hypothetical protein
MSFYRGPNAVMNGLVVFLDANNPKSYISSSSNWNDLMRNSYTSLINIGFNNGSLVFSGSVDSALVVSQSIVNNCSIEVFVKPYNNTTEVKYLTYSDHFSIVSNPSGSTNYFYFLRKVTDTTANFGDSFSFGYTGIRVDLDFNTYNHLIFTNNTSSGVFKVYKNGILTRTTDGFYNNRTNTSTGYGSLTGQDPRFLIGNNTTT